MGTPYIKLRDPGECRIVKMTRNKIDEIINAVKYGGKTIEFTDSIVEGLKLVVYSSGKAVWRHRWVDKITKKKMFFTIGEAMALSPDQARTIALERKARIAQGQSPDGVAATRLVTFEAFIENDFLPYARHKYKNFRDVESRLKTWLLPHFGKRALVDVTKADVIRFHEGVQQKKSAITANRSLSLLSSVMKRAADMEVIVKNPCKAVAKFPEGESRSRHLNDDELSRFMKALQPRLAEMAAQVISLALATGKRRGELMAARWSNVDLVERRLTIPNPKNRRTDHVALNSQAHALLVRMHAERDPSNDWVFPSKSKSGHLTEIRRTFRSIAKAAGISAVRPHDLRRTHASILINAGASIYEVRDILNHRDLRSTQVYARLATSTLSKTSELAAQKMEEALNA